jgi:hypothetical protein
MEIMKELEIPAVIFVNMNPVLGGTCWSALVTYLLNYNKDFRRFISRKYQCRISSKLFLYCKRDDVEDFLSNFGAGVIKKVDAYHGGFMSDGELLKSAEYGVYIGNHLFDHYNATQISSGELRRQYLVNESFIKRYVNYVPLFSYPFGQPRSCYNNATHDILLSSGANRLFTAMPFFNKNKEARVIHRTAMFDNVSSESFFRSQVFVPAYINHLFRKRDLESV